MQRQPHDHQAERRAAPPRPEQAADQQVVDYFLASLGPLRRQGQELIHYAHDTGIPGRDIQAAAEAAAADDSPVNRLQAANVYVIGRAAGHASEGELESRASQAMESDYEAHGLSPDSDAAFDGYTGHSEADVAFRTGRRPEGSQATP